MKKTNNFLKDNKGAALISIMIAVAFISILASALLYMSYSNYQMKVVNYQSKVNFYGVESDMTEVATAIRNDVACATNPMQALKDAVGYTKQGDIERYSPSCLASLVYSGVTANKDNVGAFPVTMSGTDTATFSAVDSSVSNFIVSTTGNVSTVTLKGVVIEHRTTENGYEHKITTDLVFIIKESTKDEAAGGVGEFSVLSDGSMKVDSANNMLRITTYGNVYMGPGTYQYQGGAVNPGAEDSLVLTGNSYFTQKGDYMVIFGNLVLEDNAVLNVMSGRLTVIGDITIKDNAALLCKGELYMAPGTNPETAGAYEINYDDATAGANSLVLTGGEAAVKVLTDTQYATLLTNLGLADADTTNDGIVKKILTTDAYNNLCGMMSKKALDFTENFYGIPYGTTFWAQGNLNAADCQNRLVFARTDKEGNCLRTGYSNPDGSKPTIKISDGSINLNTTIIALENIAMQDGSKHVVLTQLGSEVFNMLTCDSATDFVNSYAGGFDAYVKDDGSIDTTAATAAYEDTHKYGNFEYYPVTAGANKKSEEVEVGGLFVADPNAAVNSILNAAIGGGGGATVVETAVGYSNWVKE